GDGEPDAGSSPATTAPPTTAPTVPLAEVDTLTTAVRRDAFCDAVAPDAVEAALGGPSTESTSYADGQNARVVGRVQDIAHEFACAWTTDTAAARAWVFAPPVTPRVAAGLVEDAKAEQGCRADTASPAFGKPSIALVCRTARGVQASYRGLFGDAWLTCTVAGPVDRDEAAERADRWCVAVLDAVAS
ncbi:hypothetical protein, partial [Nocardioides sp.]|uniref:hypothetical protein n=1 Tax=Nocardioides sp. TaxID=35761 RepID=UPI002728552C